MLKQAACLVCFQSFNDRTDFVVNGIYYYLSLQDIGGLSMPYISYYPAHIYLFKVNNIDNGKKCEICSKLTIKTPGRRRSGVFIGNFELISHLIRVFAIVNLSKYLFTGGF